MAGTYCQRGIVHPCPRNSLSNPGARSQADCYCASGYWGSLALANAECLPKPPGLNCSGACKCQAGWELLQVTVGSQVIQKCVSSCREGQYATPQGCVDCPLNTYSSSREATAAEDCIPCPLGFVTPMQGAITQVSFPIPLFLPFALL